MSDINEAVTINLPEATDVRIIPMERPVDEKGRPDIRYMTPDEKLDEILMTCRKAQDLVDEHLSNLASNPKMLGMMQTLGRMFG